MKSTFRSRSPLVAGLLALAAASSGCNLLERRPEPVVEEVTPRRNERKQEIISSFETRRNQAQFDAAVARWEQGDAPGCASLLEELLKRDPSHRAARQLLADLHVEQENYPAAHQQLSVLLQDHPNDPQPVHSMALLLESSGRSNEAIGYYQRAVELEPANELYRLTYEAAKGTR